MAKKKTTLQDYLPEMVEYRKFIIKMERHKVNYVSAKKNLAIVRKQVESLVGTPQYEQAMYFLNKMAADLKPMREKMQVMEEMERELQPKYKKIPQPIRKEYWELYKRGLPPEYQ